MTAKPKSFIVSCWFAQLYIHNVMQIVMEMEQKVQQEIRDRISSDKLTFRRRIKSRLPFAGIIRRLSYSTR